MSKFLTELETTLLDDDSIWELDSDLGYHSDLLDCDIWVRKGFQTDFVSVPRIPIVYEAFGDKAHREAVIHDFLYRKDSTPIVTESQANSVFLESMEARGKGWFVRHFMYWGVCVGGWTSYHKKNVNDLLKEKT